MISLEKKKKRTIIDLSFFYMSFNKHRSDFIKRQLIAYELFLYICVCELPRDIQLYNWAKIIDVYACVCVCESNKKKAKD